jgi:hypothetical protein
MVPGGHGEKEARFPADINPSPTTALAAIASNAARFADMDKAAIDIAKALVRLIQHAVNVRSQRRLGTAHYRPNTARSTGSKASTRSSRGAVSVTALARTNASTSFAAS